MRLGSAACLAMLLCLGALLGGCSKVRFAYNHLDWFLLRRADHYFDFDKAQEKAFEADLREYLGWHRREMLPRYAAHLRRSADFFERDTIDRAEYDRLGESFEALMRDTVLPALPPVARAMRRMSPAQVDRFERELDEADEEIREQVSGDREDRAKKLVSNLSRMFTLFLVRLSHDQKEYMVGYLKENAGSPKPWLKEREARRKELLALLRSGASEAQLVSLMKGWMTEPRKGRTAEYQQSYDRFRENMNTLMFRTISSMQGRQRDGFVAKLREHAATFEELSKEVTALRPALKPAAAGG